MMKRKGDEELENWYKAFKLSAFEVLKNFKMIPFEKKIAILRIMGVSVLESLGLS